MRGDDQQQDGMFSYISPNQRVPHDHPLRMIRSLVDGVLEQLAVGDFNHDGKLDLAVVSGCCPGGGVSILLGRGDGTFEPAVYYAAGDQPVSIVAADFKHDGSLDLAVANSLSSYVSILLGNGDGTFRAGPQNPSLPASATFVTAGDFNGDGKPDLVTIGSNDVSVLLGNGDGTFQNAVVTQPSFAIQAIGVGDFNRDAKLDLVTAGTFGGSSSVDILLGNGDGTFQQGASYPGETSPQSIAVADFRRNHMLDLAISNGQGVGVSVLLGNGDGTFQTAVDYPAELPGWVTVADLNADHKLDIVVSKPFFDSSGVSIFLGNGDGTFQPASFYSAAHEPIDVAVGDFNGDRKTDIVLTDYLHDDVVVLLNTGVASFSPTTPLLFPAQLINTTSIPQAVVLTNTGTAQLSISSISASGPFQAHSTCGNSVAVGASCDIDITFKPQTTGRAAGLITIVDSASTKPQVIEVFGVGTAL